MLKKNAKIKINKLYISYILKKRKSKGPKLSVVFLSGFKSDMNGTKAKFVDKLSNAFGFEYLRFDYSGHGKSEGAIEKQTISSWVNEADQLIKEKTNYPVILIGSSMGGWISFLLSKKLKKKIKSIIGIAAAPDFTKFVIKNLNSNQKDFYKKKKYIALSSEYSKDKYIFTKKFIADAKKNFVLEKKYNINSKLYLLYGTDDSAVNLNVQLKILDTIKTNETKLFISKGSDHRMSSKEDLNMLKMILLNIIF